jgi:broad specificity phosphatase PhoE
VTTTFFLIRHATHDSIETVLAGRSSGTPLGEIGSAQAARLAKRMRREQFATIHASPRERTRETAAAIASACEVSSVETADALDEIDFGSWTGKTFEALDEDPNWRQWNAFRSMARTPGGETMLDVQRRVLNFMETQAKSHRYKKLVLVSHGDVIKAAVSYFLGLPIDAWPRFEISPASITTVVTGNWGTKILTLNEVGS